MAKGEGGGGHFDERRRAAAAKPRTFKADSPEVLAAIQKPKAKPVVVVKKKKVLPSRVKVESDSGEPAEAGTKMVVTRYNTGRLKPQNTGFVSPAREPKIVPQNTGFVSPSVSTLKPQNYGFANLPDYQTPERSTKGNQGGNYPTPDRSAKGNRGGGYTPREDVENSYPSFGNWNPGGSANSLLNWVKKRNARRMADM